MPIPLGEYRSDEFFAYVEDAESLAEKIPVPEKSAWWRQIFEARSRQDLGRPTSLIWLDCVRARYFDELEWRDERCEIGDLDAARIRRARILDLDDSQFVIAPLFTGEGPREPLDPAQFARGQWHRVTIDNSGEGAPILVSPDYDFGAGSLLRYLRIEAECTGDEIRSLQNVFNLNFLREGRIDRGKGGSEPEPPPWQPLDERGVREGQLRYLVS